MQTGERVKVVLPTVTFEGVVSEIRGVEVIVRPDSMTPEIERLRSETFDPPGCIVIHNSKVTNV